MTARLRVGVSACLAGEMVRWDGGHKRDAFVTEALGALAELVSVCPEVEAGLGVPREPIRLERRDGVVRVVAPGSGRDHTERIAGWAASRLRELAALDLDGYVLKARSPSCGLAGVPVTGVAGAAPADGRGRFAEALTAAFPDLPVEEESRLADASAREAFIARLFAFRRMKERKRGSSR